MGTHGLFAIVYNGITYTWYNHWDSYPSSLGIHLAREVERTTILTWIRLLRLWIRNFAHQHNDEDVIDTDGSYLDVLCGRSNFESGPPASFVFVEYTYTLDLDAQTWTVESNSYSRTVDLYKFNAAKWLKDIEKWEECGSDSVKLHERQHYEGLYRDFRML